MMGGVDNSLGWVVGNIVWGQRCWWGCLSIMDFGEILYWHNVVGDITYSIYTKMGGAI